MKTMSKITVMLIAMTIGTLAASAQSARRGTSQEDQERKVSSTTSNPRSSQATSNKASTYKQASSSTERTGASRSQSAQRPAQTSTTQRSTQSATPQRTQQSQGAQRSYESRTSQGNNQSQGTQRTYQSQTPQRSVQNKDYERKTSTTNSYNPRSNYREADRTVQVGKTYMDPKANRQSAPVVHEERKVVHHNDSYHKHDQYRPVYYPNKNIKVHVHAGMHNHYGVSYYPAYSEIIWTNRMHRYYIDLYPHYTAWHYHPGYRIQTISAFDARFNVGEISRVYGRVYATWYNRESDDLLLFFGGEYPYQEFTMVIPGYIARKYSWRPEKYFLGQHVFATGLITQYEGKPEMVVKKKNQLDVY